MSVVSKYLKELWVIYTHRLLLVNLAREVAIERISTKITTGKVLGKIGLGVLKAPAAKAWKILRNEHKDPNKDLPQFEALYINGVMTSDTAAEYEAKWMSSVFGCNFTLMYNKTESIWEDLIECARMRVRNKANKDSEALKSYITRYAANGVRNFFIIGYSQGSLVAAQALNDLDDEIWKKIHVTLVTLGGAIDELTDRPNLEAIHVAHNEDFVARTGVIHYYDLKQVSGRLSIQPGVGHLPKAYRDTLSQNADLVSTIKDMAALQ